MTKTLSNIIDQSFSGIMLKSDQPVDFVWWPTTPMKRVETCYLKDLQCDDCKSREMIRFNDPSFELKE
ncbi:hypothetical protein KAR91_67840, partial [Candidatus Pacearchaeota archaeon]|nr:hypothetical protein [Candidatus Pacearchaeota archaeon]